MEKQNLSFGLCKLGVVLQDGSPDEINTDYSLGIDGRKLLERVPNKDLCQMN